MPDIEVWSVDTLATAASADKRLQELAINFGAPGDRRDADGKLWIEYPAVAGEPPSLSIAVNPEARVFQYHSSSQAGTERPWVLASGLEGITDLRIGFLMKERIKVASDDADDEDEESSAKKKKTSSPKSSVKIEKMAKASPQDARQVPSQKGDIAPELYDIRLHFAIPLHLPGEHLFEVRAQGQTAIKQVRLDSDRSKESRQMVHELNNVSIAEELHLQFIPQQGLPILNGIEIIHMNRE
jgi:hypothetical protein